MKKLIAYFVLVFSFFVVANSVSADCGGQYGQYGTPCSSYSIVVDKLVGFPGSSNDANSYSYVDNLSVSDAKFTPNQYVFFKVNVKNTSNTTLDSSSSRDYVPTYLNPIEYPGTYDSNNRTITWDSGAFDINQVKTYYIKMQVAAQNSLPADQSITCITNRAQAWSNGITNDDSSQFCVQKQVVTAPIVPSTGPEFGYILVAGEMAMAAAGVYLRKRG